MLFGAFFIEFVPLYAARVNKSAPTLLYGLILIVVLYALPGGAAGLVDSAIRVVRRASTRLERI
jgi:branched-chain amino acid transport system permease protein